MGLKTTWKCDVCQAEATKQGSSPPQYWCEGCEFRDGGGSTLARFTACGKCMGREAPNQINIRKIFRKIMGKD